MASSSPSPADEITGMPRTAECKHTREGGANGAVRAYYREAARFGKRRHRGKRRGPVRRELACDMCSLRAGLLASGAAHFSTPATPPERESGHVVCLLLSRCVRGKHPRRGRFFCDSRPSLLAACVGILPALLLF